MLNTRYTPTGHRRKRKPSWQQIGAIALSCTMVVCFLTFGLRYMLIASPANAHPAAQDPSPLQDPSIPPSPAPPSGTPAASDSAAPSQAPSSSPVSASFENVLQEDSLAGKWLYEDAEVSIEINRNKPMDNVVATVAVITSKTDALVLKTAFAQGAFSQNVRARTRDIASSVNAVFAINGDYCGYRTDGIIVRDGTLHRNVAARQSLCLFADGKLQIMDEDAMDAEALLTQGLMDTWSFGPLLVDDGVKATEFSTDVKKANPRTALGQLADGSYVAVVVDGRQPEYSVGMTIEELAQYMLDLGCVTAYNLDGGMTSCMYFNGNVISMPCGTANKERSLSDIIYVGQ